MNTNLSTLGFAERKHLVRLLVEEVIVNTSTEEITVRHILPVDQTFPLCKRSTYSSLERTAVGAMEFPLLQVPRFEEGLDEPEELFISDSSPEKGQ